MLYTTSKQQVQEYRNNEALSQSDLKKLIVGMDAFMDDREQKMTEPMLIGSAVDTILTGAEGDFEEIFYLSNFPKPSDTICEILQEVLSRTADKSLPLEDNIEILGQVINEVGYQARWKPETRINDLLKHTGYYQSLQESIGKIVISEEQSQIINTLVESLRSSLVTESLFAREKYVNNPKWDIYYQLPIFWTMDGIPCKGLLDIVIVRKNDDGKVIDVLPFDLKIIMDKLLSFHNNVRLRRYDIQAAYYTDGLLLAENLPFEVTKENLRNFKFVVGSVANTGKVLICEASDDLLEIGRVGMPELIVEDRLIRQEILGYKNLLALYEYYQTQGWQEEKILYDNDNFLTLEWEKLYGNKV